MLQTREKSILEAIIREYIQTGEPVSSKRIAEQDAHLDSSPATIRNVMAAITNQGYITQPYTSAGRIPTRKGYRFFVDNCMRAAPIPQHLEVELREANDWMERLRLITRCTHLFTIVAAEGDSVLFNFGIGEVLGKPEFENPKVVHQFGKFIDVLSDNIDDYRAALEQTTPRVFIEEENPIPEARFMSIIAAPVARKCIILAVGPSRMDYESTTNLLQGLISLKMFN